VRRRHDPVLTALDDEDRGRGLRDLESPRHPDGAVVSDQAAGPGLAPRNRALAGGSPGPGQGARSAAVKLSGSNSSVSANRARAARPSRAARRPPGARMPANQAKSSVYGAMPATVTAPVTRSPRRAAHASACGPPPDAPITAKRPTPNASAIAATSAAADPTSRPGRSVDPP